MPGRRLASPHRRLRPSARRPVRRADGTAVTITGTNFVTPGGPGSTTISFGATAATNVSCSSATTCTGTSPAGSGSVDVTVTTVNGTSATSRGDQYSYGPPTVSAITPASGPASGGTSVTVTGAGLTTDAVVKFGGVQASSATCALATSCTAISPPGTAPVDITVSTPGGISSTSQADQFSYAGDLTSEVSVPVPDAGGAAPTEIDAISCPVREWCGAVAPQAIDQHPPGAHG